MIKHFNKKFSENSKLNIEQEKCSLIWSSPITGDVKQWHYQNNRLNKNLLSAPIREYFKQTVSDQTCLKKK